VSHNSSVYVGLFCLRYIIVILDPEKSSESWAPPKDWSMRLPDTIKECVCFLSVQYTGGPDAGKYRSIGTGLFVLVSESGWDFLYLITAKHVIDWAKKKNFTTLFARLNTQDGSFKYIDVGFDWMRYTDNHDIDIAATPVPLPPHDFQYQALPIRMIATDDKILHHGIGIGDDIFVAGLFSRREGSQRNRPIVRTGSIAAMPDESLPGKSGKRFMAYLIELLSIGGLSGSPVFVYLDNQRCVDPKILDNKEWMFFLLGLVRGHWNLNDVEFTEAREHSLEDDTPPGAKAERLNTGIAVVTPAQYIHTLLMSPVVQKTRHEFLDMKNKDNAPPSD